jgi:hypothetical protein
MTAKCENQRSISNLPAFWLTFAALEAERRALGERKSELLTLKAQSNSLPVEVDAARAAETEARAQLDRHRAGERWR